MTVFTDFFTQLRHNIDQLHQDRQHFYQQTRAGIVQLAQQVRNDLAEMSADLQAGGKAFRRGHKKGR